ncbi:MAG: FAD-dependent oxidoreductase [Alphaproteobacteria bacterium]|jgi:pyruvate/2-oxoglutarate dehydrogenase complex dihydrolipoamide dehydrogenase (E3) component|nr:FAD-dependent oxidoreductase [Alphaproteobacteria bacterium]MDP6564602.1 FAD-dependent oxidoreductase [Alphaproteobacteria bacterium]MDP6814535.1 FAD-dependent oxidoreductase [Alphaproteobacteria bacterium]
MAPPSKVDICVIGGGSGGLSVAAGAAQLGVSVALVERHLMGGDCLNFGCVPSKALLAAAKTAHAMANAGRFGLNPASPNADPLAVRQHIREVIAAIAPHDSPERFRELGVDVIKATARFVGPREIEAGGRRISARRFVIATGSSPLLPPIPGLPEVPYLTNETIFENAEVKRHLIVIGGGPIGLELAQAHRRLGAEVTVLEMLRPLPKDDAELAAVVIERLRREGVEILTGAKVTAASAAADGIAVRIDGDRGEREITGSHLLVAAGRQVNVADLNLDAAGIDHSARGITVDRRLRTSNKKVFAIGDVAGGLQFTHVAGHHAGIVIRNALFRLPAKADRAALPWVTYTDPELAHVGLDEERARATHGGIRVVRWPFAENDRAQTERETDGLIKVVTARNGRILGASIVGAHAGELIQPWILAIDQGLKMRHLAGSIAPYPTLGEVGKRAAGKFFQDSLFSPRTRTIVRFLARFG